MPSTALRSLDLISQSAIEIAPIEHAGERVCHAQLDTPAIQRRVCQASSREFGELRQHAQVIACETAFVHFRYDDATISAVRRMRTHGNNDAHGRFARWLSLEGFCAGGHHFAALEALAQPRSVAEHELL